MYKYQNSFNRFSMLSRYKLIFNLLFCLLAASFILTISGFTTSDTARISKNSPYDSPTTKETELDDTEKVTIEKSRTSYLIPLLIVIIGFVIFIIFTFISPILEDSDMFGRLK